MNTILLTSLERHSGVFNPMTSKHFWPRVNLGYKIKKPKLRRKPGRPRKSRIKASDEPGANNRRRCPECHELGHTAKKCQGGLTAREKKRLLSTDNESGEGSNGLGTVHTSQTRRRGTTRSSPNESFKYVLTCTHLVYYILNSLAPA